MSEKTFLPTTPSPNERAESLVIEQDNKKYILLMKTIGDSISFKVSIPESIGSTNYIRKLSLNEIKEKETHEILLGLKSLNEFVEYLKALSEMKKISIIQKEKKLVISFIIEFLNIQLKLIYSPKK